MIASDLNELLRDPTIAENDRQNVLSSLRQLADKGDETARLALDNFSPSLRGDLKNLSFAAVFDTCCNAGWSEKEFEFWKRWRRAILADVDIFAGIDATAEEIASWRSAPTRIDEGVLYGYCKSRGMTVPECHVFLGNWALTQPIITTALSTMQRPVTARVRRSQTTDGFSANSSGTPSICPTMIGPPKNCFRLL